VPDGSLPVELIDADGQTPLVRNITNTMWVPVNYAGKRNGEPLWNMRCKCGTEKQVLYKNYLRGLSLSCGCYRQAYATNRRGANRLPLGDSARNQLMLIYRRGAKVRGLSFELSRDAFVALISGNCHYCGHPPHQVLDRGRLSPSKKSVISACIYNGIDRTNSAVGYLDDNCVSCCRMCNVAKSDMPLASFELWLDQVAEFRSKR